MSIFRTPTEKSFDCVFMGIRPALKKALVAHFGKPSSDYFASVTLKELLEAPGIGPSGAKTVVYRLMTAGIELWLDDTVDKTTRMTTLYQGDASLTPAHYYRDYLMADPVLDDTIVALGELYGELFLKDLLGYLDDPDGFKTDAALANDTFGSGEWTDGQVFGAFTAFRDQFDANLHSWSQSELEKA